MDLQSFIQSGLLEAYVAGQCNATERQEVEHMVAQHPEIRAELAKIEQALENFAFANAVLPPEGLKNRILDQLAKKMETPEAPEMPNNAISTPPKAKSSSLRLYQVLTLTLAALASFFFWRSMFISAENKELNNKATTLQTQIDDCAKRREQAEPMANLLRDSDTHPVILKDGDVGKSYAVRVFNNTVRKECALDVTSLPVPSPGQHFQFWAIVDGVPVSMGMVTLDAIAGWQPLPYIENATAYAISQEPTPKGSLKPTVVVASGNLSAG